MDIYDALTTDRPYRLAMAVEVFDDIIRLKEKLEAHGYPSCGIDHGFWQR